MRKFHVLILISIAFLISSDTCFAYTIRAKDHTAYVFVAGKVKKDSSRYNVTYKVDEANNKLIAVEEVDAITGEVWRGGVYEIVEQPTMELFKQGSPLKAMRFNPKLATVETIVFNGGEYHYSKTTGNYINLFYGAYELDF